MASIEEKQQSYLSLAKYETLDFDKLGLDYPSIYNLQETDYKYMKLYNAKEYIFSSSITEYRSLLYMKDIIEQCLTKTSEYDSKPILWLINYINYLVIGLYKLNKYNRTLFEQIINNERWILEDKYNIFKSNLLVSTTDKDFVTYLLIFIYLYIYHILDSELNNIIRSILQSILQLNNLHKDGQYRQLIDSLPKIEGLKLYFLLGSTILNTNLGVFIRDEIVKEQIKYILDEIAKINAEEPSKQAEEPSKQAEIPSKQAEIPSKQAEEPSKQTVEQQKTSKKDLDDRCPSKIYEVQNIDKKTDQIYGIGVCDETEKTRLGRKISAFLHPNRNFGCVDEAKTKFQNFTAYCEEKNKRYESVVRDDRDDRDERDVGKRYKTTSDNYFYIPNMYEPDTFLTLEQIQNLLNVPSDKFAEISSLLELIIVIDPNFASISPTKKQIIAKLQQYINKLKETGYANDIFLLEEILNTYKNLPELNKYLKYRQKYMILKAKLNK